METLAKVVQSWQEETGGFQGPYRGGAPRAYSYVSATELKVKGPPRVVDT